MKQEETAQIRAASFELGEKVLILNLGCPDIKKNPVKGKVIDYPHMNHSTLLIGGGWEYSILIKGRLFKRIGERNMQKVKRLF